MNGLVIRFGFGKWALCDGKGEGFCLGTVVKWCETWDEANELRIIVDKAYNV